MKLINQLLLIGSTICIYEFLIIVKFTEIIKSSLKLYNKIIALFSFKKASDSRKEKLILSYSKSLLIDSTKIFIILICILTFIVCLNQLSNTFLDLLISVIGVIEITLFLIIYHNFREKVDAKL